MDVISVIKNNMWLTVSLLVVALSLGFFFSDGLIYMEKSWNREEYSHGYLIPVISFWFIWQNKGKLLDASQQGGSWVGYAIVLFGLLLGLVGELATLFIITQYAFIITLFGLCLAFVGWKGMRWLWFPLSYLVFMIPLPNFLYNTLSSELQLISSWLGVLVIRAFDISVNLQGNVIDLGIYQLQVVEACSGLRYLFPLMSFGYLCAFLFKGKFWMRAIIFLSTIPITVLMNSFRIGVIGVLVEYWGIEQAEGFLHDFEGWIIFVGCLGILYIEMRILAKLFFKDKNFSEVFVIDAIMPAISDSEDNVDQPTNADSIPSIFTLPKTYLVACVSLLIMLPLVALVGDREEQTPDRLRFTNFPLQIEDWKGVEVGMGQEFIDTLKFDDYIIGNYTKKGNLRPVNFYVAYYASQRKGASAHSPKSCIPGDGWRIGDFDQRSISSVLANNGEALRVNRAVISKGKQKQLVYYWFQQRGRIITNEYLVKWFLFWDALTKQRTDGALVRLVFGLPEGMDVVQGDDKLEEFLKDTFPLLEDYVPN
jgi:exosortase D (VPLPA-CTERM-specific)